MSELTKALCKAQQEFKPVAKDKTGRTGNQTYKYADLNSVLEATLPALNKHGIAVVQPVSTRWEEGALVVIICTRLKHESGEESESQFEFPAGELDIKRLGSTITYMRRYGYISTVCIFPDDDDDGEAAPKTRVSRKKAEDPLIKKRNELLTKFADNGVTATELTKFLRKDVMTATEDDLKALYEARAEIVRTGNVGDALTSADEKELHADAEELFNA